MSVADMNGLSKQGENLLKGLVYEYRSRHRVCIKLQYYINLFIAFSLLGAVTLPIPLLVAWFSKGININIAGGSSVIGFYALLFIWLKIKIMFEVRNLNRVKNQLESAGVRIGIDTQSDSFSGKLLFLPPENIGEADVQLEPHKNIVLSSYSKYFREL